MSTPNTIQELKLLPFDNRRLVNLCGRFDEHLRQIEKRLQVNINNRGNVFQVEGTEEQVNLAIDILKAVFKSTLRTEELTPIDIHGILKSYVKKPTQAVPAATEFNSSQIPVPKAHPYSGDCVLRGRFGEIKTRTPTQKDYVQRILNHDINFGIGPAGTGKTYLAVACAVAALEQEKVRQIILVRPAVEAGERLGFLPGDLNQKIDPYIRPLYDALYEMLGFEKVLKLIEQNVIEIAPLAYMRGRTLSDAFIILDESQNTTPEQMKMFLTRIGFNSTVVITGDVTQIDLPHHTKSGLKQVINVLINIPNISFTYFNSTDVVRHPVVQLIIEAYEAFDKTKFSNRGHPA